MMKLVLTIGVERFLVGLMDNIETDVRRWGSFVRSPKMALHNHEAEITNLNSNHAQTAVGLDDPAGQIGGTIWCHPGTDPGERVVGWGARIRTWEWRYQKPLPYHLATPQ